jgi:hypothetical protein
MTEEFKTIAINKLFNINENSAVFTDFKVYLVYKDWFFKTLKKLNPSFTKRILLKEWNLFEKQYVVLLKIKNDENDKE